MEQISLDFNGNSASSSIELSETPSEEERFVDCPYKIAGCTEKVEKNTPEETDHAETCEFRPIPCLMQQSCTQLVPYHNFLLHQMQHFLQPKFAASLTTNVVFQKDDFTRNQQWSPQWINCYNRDFFFMISHRSSGMWHFWVWILGSEEEANQYYYEIEVCKGENRKSGTYSSLSIRTSTECIEGQEIAMSMTDYQIKNLSQIRENIYGCKALVKNAFDIDLVIHKLKNTQPTRTFLPNQQEQTE